jgi:hypothetical protein
MTGAGLVVDGGLTAQQWAQAVELRSSRAPLNPKVEVSGVASWRTDSSLNYTPILPPAGPRQPCGSGIFRRETCRKCKAELRQRMHRPIREQAEWLKQVVTGFFQYHAVPTNRPALGAFATMSSSSGGARFGDAARSAA